MYTCHGVRKRHSRQRSFPAALNALQGGEGPMTMVSGTFFTGGIWFLLPGNLPRTPVTRALLCDSFVGRAERAKVVTVSSQLLPSSSNSVIQLKLIYSIKFRYSIRHQRCAALGSLLNSPPHGRRRKRWWSRCSIPGAHSGSVVVRCRHHLAEWHTGTRRNEGSNFETH